MKNKKRYTKRLQEIEEYIKKLNEDLNKLGRNQYNDNKDLE